MNKKILLVLFFAFIIRLIALNQSLWLDEAVTAKVVMNYSFFDIVSRFSPTDFHPPLYYLFMKIWTNAFGYSEISLRLPSVMFSLLTGYLVYLIGKKIKNTETGFWAMIFFLFNPLIVYYSQEARIYMMAVFLLSVATFLLININYLKDQVESSNVKSQMSKMSRLQFKTLNFRLVSLFSIFITLSFLTFYGSIFLIAAFLLYLIFKKEYSAVIISGLTLSIAMIFIWPLFSQQLANSKLSLQIVANWPMVLGTANLKNLLLIPMKFAFGRISFYPKYLYWLLAGCWTAVVWIFITKGILKNRWLGFILLFPLTAAFIFSFSTPLLQYFRFIYLIPIASLLISLAVKSIWLKKVLAGIFLGLSLVYLLLPIFHREDWKSLGASIPAQSEVNVIIPSADALKYYRKDLILEDLRGIETTVNFKNEFLIIPYTSEIYGFDYKKILLKNNYTLVNAETFRGVFYELWQKK